MARKIPMRRCVGCMVSKPKNELIRIVCSDEGIRIDPTGKANGRGAYVCPDEECIRKAAKNKGFQRSFGRPVDPKTIDGIIEELLKIEKNA